MIDNGKYSAECPAMVSARVSLSILRNAWLTTIENVLSRGLIQVQPEFAYCCCSHTTLTTWQGCFHVFTEHYVSRHLFYRIIHPVWKLIMQFAYKRHLLHGAWSNKQILQCENLLMNVVEGSILSNITSTEIRTIAVGVKVSSLRKHTHANRHSS